MIISLMIICDDTLQNYSRNSIFVKTTFLKHKYRLIFKIQIQIKIQLFTKLSKNSHINKKKLHNILRHEKRFNWDAIFQPFPKHPPMIIIVDNLQNYSRNLVLLKTTFLRHKYRLIFKIQIQMKTQLFTNF